MKSKWESPFIFTTLCMGVMLHIHCCICSQRFANPLLSLVSFIFHLSMAIVLLLFWVAYKLYLFLEIATPFFWAIPTHSYNLSLVNNSPSSTLFTSMFRHYIMSQFISFWDSYALYSNGTWIPLCFVTNTKHIWNSFFTCNLYNSIL